MTEISLHIQYLLRYHDCVILPGLGAFVKSYRKATITPDGAMTPPVTEVSFNSSITSNDGLLAHSIMRRNDLTFEEARTKVAEAVEQIKSTMRSDRELAFGRIGILSLGEDDNICFRPFAPAIPEVFGSISKKAAAEPLPETDREAAQESESRRFDTRRNYYIPINKRFAKVAATLMLAIASVSTFVVPSLHDTQIAGVQRASVVPIAPHTTEDTRSASAQPSVKPETEDIQTAGTVTPSDTTAYNNFYLIVGTFRTTDECAAFIESMPDETASTLRIAKGKKLCRVYAATSSDRDELLAEMRDDTFRSKFPQAWIWHP